MMLMQNPDNKNCSDSGPYITPSPWSTQQDLFFEDIRKQLPFDALAVGLINTKQPRLDEILAARGWPQDAIVQWCQTGYTQDKLYQTAKRRGIAIDSENEETADNQVLPKHDHLMQHILPESLVDDRCWWLLVARDGQPFSTFEQQIASLLLRQWQARFNGLIEPNSCRLLVGQDGRLIHADPWTRACLVKNPEMLSQLLGMLNPIADQRWGNSTTNGSHDFATELDGKPYWVCFHHNQALDTPDSKYWHLHLRPLEAGELPTIGPIEDHRVAKSLAYIHDNFNQSPTLTQVAQNVGVSPFHFHRLFMKHVGISPKQYLQRKQMQVAKWLLRSSRQSIGKVASQSGFASHGHFTSTFQRMAGMTPRQYRESN